MTAIIITRPLELRALDILKGGFGEEKGARREVWKQELASLLIGRSDNHTLGDILTWPAWKGDKKIRVLAGFSENQ